MSPIEEYISRQDEQIQPRLFDDFFRMNKTVIPASGNRESDRWKP